jgi:hypothetical protein
MCHDTSSYNSYYLSPLHTKRVLRVSSSGPKYRVIDIFVDAGWLASDNPCMNVNAFATKSAAILLLRRNSFRAPGLRLNRSLGTNDQPLPILVGREIPHIQHGICKKSALQISLSANGRRASRVFHTLDRNALFALPAFEIVSPAGSHEFLKQPLHVRSICIDYLL